VAEGEGEEVERGRNIPGNQGGEEAAGWKIQEGEGEGLGMIPEVEAEGLGNLKREEVEEVEGAAW
jgi:hypothetical protein